jgi:hypothetical protein
MQGESSSIETRQIILLALKDSKEPLNSAQIYQKTTGLVTREMISKEIFFMCKDGVLERISHNNELLCYHLSDEVIALLAECQKEKPSIAELPAKPKTTDLVHDVLQTHYQEYGDNDSLFMSDAQIAALVQPALSNSAVRHAVIRLIKAGNDHLERKPGFSRMRYRPESEFNHGENTDTAIKIKSAINASKLSVLLKGGQVASKKRKNSFNFFLEQAGIYASEKPKLNKSPKESFKLDCDADSFLLEFNEAEESVIINHYGQYLALNLSDARKLMYFVFSNTK